MYQFLTLEMKCVSPVCYVHEAVLQPEIFLIVINKGTIMKEQCIHEYKARVYGIFFKPFPCKIVYAADAYPR